MTVLLCGMEEIKTGKKADCGLEYFSKSWMYVLPIWLYSIDASPHAAMPSEWSIYVGSIVTVLLLPRFYLRWALVSCNELRSTRS